MARALLPSLAALSLRDLSPRNADPVDTLFVIDGYLPYLQLRYHEAMAPFRREAASNGASDGDGSDAEGSSARGDAEAEEEEGAQMTEEEAQAPFWLRPPWQKFEVSNGLRSVASRRNFVKDKLMTGRPSVLVRNGAVVHRGRFLVLSANGELSFEPVVGPTMATADNLVKETADGRWAWFYDSEAPREEFLID